MKGTLFSTGTWLARTVVVQSGSAVPCWRLVFIRSTPKGATEEKDLKKAWFFAALVTCVKSLKSEHKMINQVAPFINASNRKLNLMGWTRGFYCFCFFFTLVESSSRSGKMLLLNLGTESSYTINWPILSASIFVLVALVLSMYLIFEHLAAYNQPEVCSLDASSLRGKISEYYVISYMMLFFSSFQNLSLWTFSIYLHYLLWHGFLTWYHFFMFFQTEK